jgi:hypothetical protein
LQLITAVIAPGYCGGTVHGASGSNSNRAAGPKALPGVRFLASNEAYQLRSKLQTALTIEADLMRRLLILGALAALTAGPAGAAQYVRGYYRSDGTSKRLRRCSPSGDRRIRSAEKRRERERHAPAALVAVARHYLPHRQRHNRRYNWTMHLLRCCVTFRFGSLRCAGAVDWLSYFGGRHSRDVRSRTELRLLPSHPRMGPRANLIHPRLRGRARQGAKRRGQ